jgi:hypothetical protein
MRKICIAMAMFGVLLAAAGARAQTYSLPASGEVDNVDFTAGPDIALSAGSAGAGTWSLTLIVSTLNGNSGWIGTGMTLTSQTPGLCVSIPTPSTSGRSVVGITNGAIEANQVSGTVPFPLTVSINTGCTPPLTQITVRALYDDGTPVAGSFRIDDANGNNIVSETLDSTGLFQGNVVLVPLVSYVGGIQFVGPAGANVSLAIAEPPLPTASAAVLLTLLNVDEIDITITKGTGAFRSLMIGPAPSSPATPAAVSLAGQ